MKQFKPHEYRLTLYGKKIPCRPWSRNSPQNLILAMSGNDPEVRRVRKRTMDADDPEYRRMHSNSNASTNSDTNSLKLYQTVADLWKNLPEALKNDPSVAPIGLGPPGLQSLAHLNSRGPCGLPLPRQTSISSAGLSRRSSRDYVALNMAAIGISKSLPVVCRNCGALPGLFEDDSESVPVEEEREYTWGNRVRTGVLLIMWLAFTIILMMKSEREVDTHHVSVPHGTTRTFPIHAMPAGDKLGLALSGSLLLAEGKSQTSSFLEVWIQSITDTSNGDLRDISELFSYEVVLVQNVSKVWNVPLSEEEFVDKIERTHIFVLSNITQPRNDVKLHIAMRTNVKENLPLSVVYNISPIDYDYGVIYAAIVLLALYAMIIFEIVHRTLAALIGSTASIAILAYLDERPSMAELVTWIDVETILLLFSMMIIVAILAETGIFDYIAVRAFEMTGGKVWPLINALCLLTVVLSTVLDNVTTVLLMTPVSIRLCEVTSLNPVPVLIAMMIYSNIGGAITPVGDPPNVMLASNPDVIKSGVNFAIFCSHMGVGTIIVFMVVQLHLRFLYRNHSDLRFKDPHEEELKHEIVIWQRAASSLSSYSKDEDVVRQTLVKKVRRMVADLKKKVSTGTTVTKDYYAMLDSLKVQYPIRDKQLLQYCGFAISFVVVFFFLHSIPSLKLSLGWTALLGVLMLLIVSNHEVESLLARVEWSTLLFFAALFIMMEALAKLGLIRWIGDRTHEVIMSVGQESRLTVTILLILWVSAAASAFVDNIPLTTMMIKIVTDLSRNPELNLPLQPLVWALAFGACFGGNGTLIGSSSNVVCAGVAEQHGYRFTFMEFFRIGFPVMICSMVTATLYLIVCHIFLEWNG